MKIKIEIQNRFYIFDWMVKLKRKKNLTKGSKKLKHSKE